MDRKNAPKETKWDLTDIYKSQSEFDKDIEELKQLVEKVDEFKGKLGDRDTLLKYFKYSDCLDYKSNKPGLYAFLSKDINHDDKQAEINNSVIDNLGATMSEKFAFVDAELATYPDEYYKKLMQDKEFEPYRLELEGVIDNRKHILSEKEEKALSIMSKFGGGFSDAYDDLTEHDLKFKPVKVNGKNQELLESTYDKFIMHKDGNVRKQAYDNLYEGYKSISKTLSTLYINHVKLCASDLKLRNEKSYLSSALEGQKIPEGVYYSLIKNVDKNIELEKEYFRLLKYQTKIKDFKFCDVYLSLADKLDKKFDLEAQKDIVKKALVNLGDDYQKLLDKAYSENWMDVYPSSNKSSGGYCCAEYGLHPYVLLNNNDDYQSMTTMAHELGHAMHGYYSNKEQPISTASHAIYIAEIASTTNEVLLAKYMIKHAKTDEEKLFYLGHLIENFKSTVFRQTMFSEFEDYAFKEIENGNILTQEKLDKKYKSLLTKHFDGVVNIDDNIIKEWTRISHFYRPYYVYKYATSFISAVNLASKIEKGDKEAIEKYKTLLKSGGCDYPDKLLKNAGVDLEKEETYDVAFNVLKDALDEVKQILKRQKENTKVIEK